MNAATFGTDQKFQESLDRHHRLYGPNPGQAIAEAQIRAQATRDAYGRARSVDTAPSVKHLPATERQIEYLMSLRAAKTPHIDPAAAEAWARQAGRAAVSVRIDELKALPNATSGTGAKTSDVPAGRYAVTGEQGRTVFLKVDRPDTGPFKSRTFVRVQAGEELHRISPAARDALLARIEADGVETASRRYGREIGACGVCGRTLTDADSRAEGVGPVCQTKMGW